MARAGDFEADGLRAGDLEARAFAAEDDEAAGAALAGAGLDERLGDAPPAGRTPLLWADCSGCGFGKKGETTYEKARPPMAAPNRVPHTKISKKCA